ASQSLSLRIARPAHRSSADRRLDWSRSKRGFPDLRPPPHEPRSRGPKGERRQAKRVEDVRLSWESQLPPVVVTIDETPPALQTRIRRSKPGFSLEGDRCPQPERPRPH